jgi:8-oxo-dGTP diphosphatase
VTRVVVAAAVIEREGRVLVTQRPPGVHLEGYWEFPGGKCDPGEAHADCVARELREELAVEASVGEEIYTVEHAYADRLIELHFFRCTVVGEPTPRIGQQMQWLARRDLRALRFPPADTELVELLTRSRT